MISSIITPELRSLHEKFQAHGFSIRFVGGCVRDSVLGLIPKDIDFATDATPDEQRKIYAQHGINHVATGLKHGTWTVVLGEGAVYEITSLRIETNHDGRHADTAWTRDWMIDLARRDLTINAMMMTFDGQLIDPFDGDADLRNNIVRFVGNAEDRMGEDYLRILRFFRFHARFGGEYFNDEAIDAAAKCGPGLSGISRERVWSEIARIVSGPKGPATLRSMDFLFPYIGLPMKLDGFQRLGKAHRLTKDPASLMAAYLGNEMSVNALAADWKWSNGERDQARFIARNREVCATHPDIERVMKQMLAVDSCAKQWIIETLRVADQNDIASEIIEWPIPVFPVTGNDIVALGLKPGPEVGAKLLALKLFWALGDYQMDRASLLEYARQ
jgi:tRNA nucleotidyltransferase (CCA-adding enzyme)